MHQNATTPLNYRISLQLDICVFGIICILVDFAEEVVISSPVDEKAINSLLFQFIDEVNDNHISASGHIFSNMSYDENQ